MHETYELSESPPQDFSSPLNSPPNLTEINTNEHAGSKDPFLLAARVIPADHIQDIRRRKNTQRIADFYQEQNDEIHRFLSTNSRNHRDSAEITVEDATDGSQTRTLRKAPVSHSIAIRASLYANILLSILQLYAAISSGSMSLFATMADSLFDPVSNLILMMAHKTSVKWDVEKYPSGKARMETIGNIVYAFLMTTVSVVLVVSNASVGTKCVVKIQVCSHHIVCLWNRWNRFEQC